MEGLLRHEAVPQGTSRAQRCCSSWHRQHRHLVQLLQAAQGQTLISAQLFVHEMPRPLDLPPGFSIQMLLAPSMLLCTCHCARSATACVTSAFKLSGMILALPAVHTLLRRFLVRTDIQRSPLCARKIAGQGRAGQAKYLGRFFNILSDIWL